MVRNKRGRTQHHPKAKARKRRRRSAQPGKTGYSCLAAEQAFYNRDDISWLARPLFGGEADLWGFAPASAQSMIPSACSAVMKLE